MSAAEGFEEFVSIIEQGSMTAAAEVLGLPRATLSRRLSRLEARLGVRLIHRTTRRLTLTQAGEVLFARASGLVHAAREVEAEVQRIDGVPRGLLRVSIPTETPQAAVAGWLISYLRSYPEVRLEVVASGMEVDLIGEGFDVALQNSPGEDPSLVARTLVNNRLTAVASPDYLAARGAPDRPEALQAHDCILGFTASRVPERRWPLLDGGQVPVSGTMTCNQLGMRLHAARQHLGIALAPADFIARDLAEGTLVAVLPEAVGRWERACLVYRERTLLDPKVRTFVDHLVAQIAAARARKAALAARGDASTSAD